MTVTVAREPLGRSNPILTLCPGLSVTYADTDLVGNGAAPVELLAQDRAAVFTHPDRTRNELTLLSFRASQALSNRLALTGNVYSRSSNVRTLNGDDSDPRADFNI